MTSAKAATTRSDSQNEIPVAIPRQVGFDDFTFDQATRTLSRHGVELHVEPQVAKLLGVLLAHSGQVVSRQVILQEIWPDGGGTDDALNYAVSQLRKVLAPCRSSPIKTVRGKGYRFQCTVSELSSTPKDDELVGRGPEMQRLRRLAASCLRAKELRLALVNGAAGIGKSRLVEELELEWVQRGDARVKARCSEGTYSYALYSWMSALDGRPLALETDSEDASRRFQFDLPVSTADRCALFHRLCVQIELHAQRRPLLLVLEDAHWADDATLALIHFMANHPLQAPVLLVVTCRSPWPSSHATALTALARHSSNLTLDPLGQAGSKRILKSLVTRPLEEKLEAEVLRLCAGSPLFIREYAFSLNAGGGSISSLNLGPSSPTGAVECLQWHVNTVGPECRQVLELAAVMGEVFDAQVVAHAGERDVQQVVELLAEGTRYQIVRPVSELTYQFEHGLLRRHLYDALADHERRQQHWVLGLAMAKSRVHPWANQAAHHLAEGAVSKEQAAHAVSLCRPMARELVRRFAFEAAAAEYHRMLALLARAESSAVERIEVLIRAADCARVAGRTINARELCGDAVALAREVEDHVGLAEAVFVMARCELDYPGSRMDHVRLLGEALEKLPQSHKALRARLLGQVAQGLTFAGQPEKLEAACREAIELAADADPKTQALVACARLMAYWGDLSVRAEWRKWPGQLVVLGREANEPIVESIGLWFQIIEAMELGHAQRACRFAEVAVEFARRVGYAVPIHHFNAFHACLAVFRGAPNAEELVNKAFETGREVLPDVAAELYQGQLCILSWEHNQGRHVAEQFRAMSMNAKGHPVFVAAEAFSWALAGEEAHAREAYAEMIRRNFPMGQGNGQLATAALLAEVAAWLGERQGAQLLYDRLHPYRQELAITGACHTAPAIVGYSLGQVAASLGRWDTAREHYADAKELAQRCEAPRWVRRCEIALERTAHRSSPVGWRIRAVDAGD